ncbi:exodeoxyribonuclease VII small subunit [Pseudothauera lacus]|uniref:Exodeoxyribonuclease 7 small subunit n=1 Tax=Pseudothauera lacus TaxID=2136175 RepID=A0A2T4IE65_9RHOO|nr:exodeoxyribonuclease VII small subunit [Pseudothauera lacus]PTD96026.1 exodeoxyribonuclease VII small subunit [Pseudothauera lacus]
MVKTAAAPKNFESAVAELETIVRDMEAGSLALEQALERYQRGTELLRYCQQTLSAAEARVRVLEGDKPVAFGAEAQ